MSHLALELIDLRNEVNSLKRELSNLRIEIEELKRKLKAHDEVIERVTEDLGW